MLRYAVELVVGGGQVVGMSTSTERGSIDRTVSSIGGALGAYENVLQKLNLKVVRRFAVHKFSLASGTKILALD